MVQARARALTVSYLETLPTLVPPIFEQAQHSTANHRKNVVALHKIHQAAASITEDRGKGVKPIGEKAFCAAFLGMVNRVLPVKKGVSVAERVVKFVAAYAKFLSDQDIANRAEDEEEFETMASRFVAKLLSHLLAGTDAKDKNVRYRVTMMLVTVVNGLEELDEDTIDRLRSALLSRSRDKEAIVRVQAAFGLAKLLGGEDDDELTGVLLDLLRYDPAAEVRRAALCNLPRTAEALPHILARTRDVDPTLRKVVYKASLGAVGLPDAKRSLSAQQREQVVKNGLGDRDPNVRNATAAMLGVWLDQAEGNLLEFVTRFFDVLDSEVAEEALISLFSTRPETVDSVEFNDEYWADLTPERALLIRVFGEYCKSAKKETRFDEAMPVVTALAYRTQDAYNNMVAATEEEDIKAHAFVVGELLTLSGHLDYADETGRRKMFQLTRGLLGEMISQINLPEMLIPKCLDVLSKIANGEKDLIRIVVDVITELRAGEEEEDADMTASVTDTPAVSRKSSSLRIPPLDPEAQREAALIDLRCLQICNSLLERVNSTLQDNSVFQGLVPDLIVPAIKNTEMALRDQGLACLGLCCMIEPKLATRSFGLFVSQIQAADDQLKVKIVQIVFDLLMVQDIQRLVSESMSPDDINPLISLLLQQTALEVLAVACEGAAKLMLAGIIEDSTILQSLILLYFSPETYENQPVRQCLTYFLPVFCYSSPAHQRQLLSIFQETFEILRNVAEASEDEPGALPLSQMGLMMIDWLDPQKVAEGVNADASVHLDLVAELCQMLLRERAKETRRAAVSFLSKLHLPEPEEVPEWKIKSAIVWVTAVREAGSQLLILRELIPMQKRPFRDATSKNALNRFEAALNKRYVDVLKDFQPEAFRSEDQPQVKEMYDFIDEIEEDDVDAQSDAGSTRKRANGRRYTSRDVSEAPSEVTITESEDDEENETPRRHPKSSSKRQAAEEDSDEDVESVLDDDSDVI